MHCLLCHYLFYLLKICQTKAKSIWRGLFELERGKICCETLVFTVAEMLLINELTSMQRELQLLIKNSKLNSFFYYNSSGNDTRLFENLNIGSKYSLKK